MKHLIELCPGDWVDQMSKMNEEIDERNQHQEATGKRRLTRKISNNEFWKFIGCILLEFNYGEKGYMIWVSTTIKDSGKAEGKIDRDVCGKTYLLRVSCTLYRSPRMR